MKIIQWDKEVIDAFDSDEDLAAYRDEEENYSNIFFKSLRYPDNSWAVPFVTGHRYKISWSDTGLDFTRMRIDLSRKWTENDLDVGLVFNHTDVREAVYFTLPDSTESPVVDEDHIIKESTLPDNYNICGKDSTSS